LRRIFYGNHIPDIFHHAKQGTVPAGIAANGTQFIFTNRMTLPAIAYFPAQPADGFAKTLNILRVFLEQVKHHPQSRTASNARQTREFPDGFFHYFRRKGAQNVC
jgi:hypothetical protein